MRLRCSDVTILAAVEGGLEKVVDEIARYGCDHSGCGGGWARESGR